MAERPVLAAAEQKQLNEVPGVVGSLLCDEDGRLLAHAFPPLFDAALLSQAAATLADSAVALETMAGPVGLLDFRYAEARLVVKPIERSRLLMLCAKNINVQLLLISASVASSKLTRMAQESSRVQAAAPVTAAEPVRAVPQAAPAAQASPPEPGDGKKKAKMPRWSPSL